MFKLVATCFVASRKGIRRSVRSDSESDDSDDNMDMKSDGESSSGSESEDESVSEDSDDGKAKPRRNAAVPKKKATPKKKGATAAAPTKSSASRKRKQDSESSENEDEEEMEGSGNNQNEVKVLKQVQNRTFKEQLIADILCRWWYVMPEWPPSDFDFKAALEKAGLRLVSLDRWEDEPDQDKQGRVKCYALTQFKGLYRDARGALQDLRPKEGKPCFSFLYGKNEKELQGMLASALGKQIEILSHSKEKTASSLISDLKEKLKNVSKKK